MFVILIIGAVQPLRTSSPTSRRRRKTRFFLSDSSRAKTEESLFFWANFATRRVEKFNRTKNRGVFGFFRPSARPVLKTKPGNTKRSASQTLPISGNRMPLQTSLKSAGNDVAHSFERGHHPVIFLFDALWRPNGASEQKSEQTHGIELVELFQNIPNLTHLALTV